jgi:hypothetical protein
VSCVYQNIDPPTPLSARRVCPPPATKAGGTHSPGGEEGGGSIFWKTRTQNWPLTVIISLRSRPMMLQENLSQREYQSLRTLSLNFQCSTASHWPRFFKFTFTSRASKTGIFCIFSLLTSQMRPSLKVYIV